MTAVIVVTRPRRDGSTAYRAQWRPERVGQLTSWTTDNRRDADAFAKHARIAGVDEAIRVWEEREKAGDRGDLTTVAAAWQHYLDHLTRPKQGTVDKYRRRVNAPGSWLPRFGEYPVAAITREAVALWVQDRGAQVSAKTVRNDGALLSALMSDCVKRGLITRTPCDDVRYPKAYREADVDPLTAAELNALLAALPEWWRPFVWTLASTGLRINETTALRWRDVDLDRALLSVRHGWHKTAGGWSLETPKTPRSRRTIDLEPETLAVLTDVLARTRELGRDDSLDGFVFTAPRGGPVRDNPFREDVWHPARKRAKIRHCSPHDMRHLHASWMLAEGATLDDVADRLGHESSQITRSTYAHLVPAKRAQTVALTRRAMAAVTPPSGGRGLVLPPLEQGRDLV